MLANEIHFSLADIKLSLIQVEISDFGLGMLKSPFIRLKRFHRIAFHPFYAARYFESK